MKKILFLVFAILAFGPLLDAMADPTIISIGTQAQLSLLSHVTAVAERSTDGVDRLEFLDGIVQFGHYKGDYIAALDAGFLDSTAPNSNGNYKMTYGIHIHALQTLIAATNVNVSPTVASLITDLELSPRYSYDTDVGHGVLGVTFGAVIPFQ